MADRSEAEVRAFVRALILELAPNSEAAASCEDPHLTEDLEYHSLALLELGFALEDEFDLQPIDQETAQQIATMAAVADFVVSQLTQSASK